MNILIVYSHPEPESINGALYRSAVTALTRSGHHVKTSDLTSMEFNPVSGRTNFTSILNPSYFKQQLEEIHASELNAFAPEISAEQEKIFWCDLMIWQFPMWWFSVPGQLKGWVDRVFAIGALYGHGRYYDTGMMRGKKALLSLTTGGGEEAYQADGFNGDLMSMLRPIHRGILEFTGFSVLKPHVVYGPVRQSKEELAAEIRRWEHRLDHIFQEEAIGAGRY